MPNTFVYVRVSTKEQSAEGVSLAVQVRECLRYCEHHSLPLHPTATNCDSPGVFVDPGVSAWSVEIFERPGFFSLWEHIQDGDTIVFLCFDRAFRNLKDFLQSHEAMKDRDVSIIFVRDEIKLDTAAGRLWAHVRAAFAEYQSSLISERVREANAIRKLEGIQRQTVTQRRQRPSDVPEDIKRMAKEHLEKTSLRHPSELKSIARVFGYVRVSRCDQDSLPQQTSVIRELKYRTADNQAVIAGLFIDDGVSAFKTDFRSRPEGRKLFSQLTRGDLIVVARLDRIFRSMHDMTVTLREWESQGICLYDMNSGINTATPHGKMMVNIMCIMAQWESESTSWRIRLAVHEATERRGPWTRTLPRWVKRVPYRIAGEVRYRLSVNMDMIRDTQHMVELLDNGFSHDEISDIIQREHETEHDFPVPIPRGGFEKRAILETRLKRDGDYETARKVRDYCVKFGIKPGDPIDRYYSLHEKLWPLIWSAKHGMMQKYIEANEPQEVGVVG